jgi:nitroreductase
MTIQEAIVARHSVRQYQEKPIEADIINRLNEEIDICNKDGGLHIQLVLDEPKAFTGGMVKYGSFKGVRNYMAMVAPKSADEKVGYYGERIVLLAQTLGLNSCWVGLSVGKQPDRYVIADGEKLHCVVALGYGANQGVQHPMRPMDKFVKSSTPMPEWFRRGMEAAILAPTAVHQQKFEFELVDDHTVAARARFSLVGWAKLDLGIVKYNFEVGAGKENFKWKN